MSVNWAAIAEARHVAVKDCWTTCDGYCCKNFLAGELSLPDADKVIVPYLPGEFAYQQTLGGLPESVRAVRQTYVLPDGRPWNVDFLHCTAKGRCDGLFYKPLVCRIYPYFPLVDLDGSIRGFEYCSLMDLFHAGPDAHPCTLARELGQAVQDGLRRSLAPALCFSEIIFAFAMFERIVTALRRAVPGVLDGEPGSEGRGRFLRAYQWQVFSRKPWATPAFAEETAALYAAMTRRHGPLDLT
ncbi:hypothetical protein [Solidesulfovibrio carbinolicus]|uniref:Uncharacterized protein n=1 Tax=Solidesulfovibrio carbinolicus TaxID=296842 RepID=A0A4P6I6A1_9BACT|nr:hypothetical protein [Solidesulfovibrio carbinolicus]QAZ69659.1 hypothetical protein C3Y92_20525 [Solidesulfovibrio carbinolicus]